MCVARAGLYLPVLSARSNGTGRNCSARATHPQGTERLQDFVLPGCGHVFVCVLIPAFGVYYACGAFNLYRLCLWAAGALETRHKGDVL